jgi:hypothetical protein
MPARLRTVEEEKEILLRVFNPIGAVNIRKGANGSFKVLELEMDGKTLPLALDRHSAQTVAGALLKEDGLRR